jgi:hypothetical protein
MISEISYLSCNDLQGLRMPTVLCYVLCLTFVGGFDSHTLPPKQMAGKEVGAVTARTV